METKRLIVTTVLSMLVLLGFEYFSPHKKPDAAQTAPIAAVQEPAAPQPETEAIRLPIDAPSVSGSINLRGARLDDLVLRAYHETVKPNSPLVRVLDGAGHSQANFIEFGWLAGAGETLHVPDSSTVWTADGAKLDVDHPVTLHWDNGQGLVFEIVMAIDRDYMFTVTQRVRNTSGTPVGLTPYSRVDRGYTPEETGGMLVHEGPISVVDGRMTEDSYKALRNGSSAPSYVSWSHPGTGGWAGITDKYWLSAVLPDQASDVVATYGYVPQSGIYQVGFVARTPLSIPANGVAETVGHVFAGAKEVRLLERYQANLHVTDFWKAVDFGWFAFLTRPVFFVLDWLNTELGNFGLALLTFTLIVKTLFFPLAAKSFRSAARMRDMQPKVKLIRERHKDDQVTMNQQIMTLYREEGVNPASGCLPLLVQAPVFWCLYKDLYVTIEMRHAPFIGWIHDLSAPDPTNIFNLFGLIPWDPTSISAYLLLGIWPILYGATMFLMQRINPTTVDPAQKQIFMMMPIIFTFFMARQPVGLVIYYCWNNLLTVAQQLLIQKFPSRKLVPAVKEKG